MTPTAWKNVQLEALFENRKERGLQGLPTISVTIGDGLIDRDQLDRKTDTTLEANEHLLVEPNDIVYNTMRMWQGASGLVTKRAIVSPAYVVAKPLPSIDAQFASYLFKTPRMIHLFWAYSHGLTDDRRRLYFDDFADIPTIVPPVAEQRRIAEILATWDRAIETTEKLIANSQAQKNALMQQLLTGKKRLRDFNESWTKVRLGELGETYGGLTGKSKEHFGMGCPYVQYKNVFDNPAVDFRDLDLVQVDDSESQNLIRQGDILFTTSSEVPEEVGMSSVVLDPPQKVYLNSFCFGYRPRDAGRILPLFAKHFFRGEEARRRISSLAQGSTRYNLSKREFLQIEFRLPPAQEQQAIASVIEDSHQNELAFRSQLSGLKREKSALMQQLLTGKRRVSLPSAQEEAAA